MTILTSIWGAQHLNAGQNIQQWMAKNILKQRINYRVEMPKERQFTWTVNLKISAILCHKP